MTTFFKFDHLTWPEVAELQKSVSLVLPLGNGYAEADLASRLGFPEKIGWLPAIPFGWKGSILALDPGLLSKVVSEVLGAYAEDGFQKLYALVRSQDDLILKNGFTVIDSTVDTPDAMKQQPEKEKVMLVPFGQTEQHAYHLPLSTDTICIEAISKGTAARMPAKALALPTFPYGVSTHRRSFAGTTSMQGRTFEDLCIAIADELIRQDYQMLYYLSGHGGNVSFLVNAIKYIGERHPEAFCATTWLYLSGPKGQEALARHRQSKIGGMGHACELETSLLLHLQPDLVHMDRVVDETEFISTPSYYQDWIEGGSLIANPPWTDDTTTGAYGAGSLAKAENGKIWLEAAIDEKVDHVLEIIEQQERRSQKRQMLINS